MSAKKFEDRVRFERKSAAQDPEYGTAIAGEWVAVGVPRWAEIQDTVPSKDESLKAGVRVARDSARIRIRYCEGLTAEMRIVELTGAKRTLSIVGGPARIFGGRELEFMVERFSS